MPVKNGLTAFSRQQRLVLLAVVLLNAAVLGGLLIILNNPLPPEVALTLPPDNALVCESNAALALRQRGVAASVTITNLALFASVNGPSAAAWDVFSVTHKLSQDGCGPYNLIRVDVPDPEGRTGARLILELTGQEIQLWADGRLTDGQLSERTRRSLYQAAPIAFP